MKMETRIAAPRAGKVAEVVVEVAQTVGSGQLLAVIE
jgi:biotin carboxyl carrier protein